MMKDIILDFVSSLFINLLRKLESSSGASLKGGSGMLGWVVTFLVVAIIAGLLGFTGIMSASAEIAKIIFFIFIILFIVSLILNLFRR